ncbi:MAG: amino acid ABC transporter permease [Anaerolineae bacterium]|nr:amino acid ABC transporter permease [Anaerolineae bacterium]
MSTTTTSPQPQEQPIAAAAVQRPPTDKGMLAWLRKNLFRTWLDTLLTLFVGYVAVSLGVQFFTWVTSQAQWAVVTQNIQLLMRGLYPVDQGWRLIASVGCITLLAGVSWGLWGRLFLSNIIAFGVALLLLFFLPQLDRVMIAEGSTFGRYLGDNLIPLLDIVKVPVAALIAVLIMGYVLGRGAKSANRKLTTRIVMILWFLLIPLVFILVSGVSRESTLLPLVPTNQWGGLLLTFMLAFVTIVFSFPLGILLALGRVSGGGTPRRIKLPRWWFLNPLNWFKVIGQWWAAQGNYPIIKLFCVVFIEFMRGIPLVTVFFTASLIVPLALAGVSVDPLIRAMVGMTLFEAAYIAEIVRGGLQALPTGQLEAAKALGLNPALATLFITLPQALRLVIPALVGQFITIFKDTSLVVIVGLLDLLGTAQSITAQAQFQERRREAYVFVFVVYFIFSYGMSYAARQLERSGSGRLNRLLKQG